MFCGTNILYLLNCITETLHLTEDRMLGQPCCREFNLLYKLVSLLY